MLAAMAFIKLAGNIQRGGTSKTAAKESHTAKTPNLVASVMAQSNGSKSKFSNFFDIDNELGPIKVAQIAQPGVSLAGTESEGTARLVNQGILLPRLGHTFWDAYGNKLRVFGTQERVIQLGNEVSKEELLVEL